MYRVAVIINSNEALHSDYADVSRILKKAIKTVYSSEDDLYSFEVFDKFNISSLFFKGDKNIFSFDSVFLSTNACNNIEILEELNKNTSVLENYIDDGNGKQHGICICNQQKLGFSLGTEEKEVSFLPKNLIYKLIKRPEKSSSDGKVKITDHRNLLVNFPNKITDEIIDTCCSGKNNLFMEHRYRYYIKPQSSSAYEVIYCDDNDDSDVEHPKTRPLLLKARIKNARVIISSMNLDWAEHLEQLGNILVYITEGLNQFAFVSKKSESDSSFENYIHRTIAYKIPFKKYDEESIKKVLAGINSFSVYNDNKKENFDDQIQIYSHKIFIFSPSWDNEEVKAMWNDLVYNSIVDVSFYRLHNNKIDTQDKMKIDTFYSKSIRNSVIFLGALEWLIANFIRKKWRKSIWTYEYILTLLDDISYNHSSYFETLVNELYTHLKEKNNDQEESNIMKSYDNVFNSSCACYNVLTKLKVIASKNNIVDFEIGDSKTNLKQRFYDVISKDRNSIAKWIIANFNNKDAVYKNNKTFDDYMNAVISLYDCKDDQDISISNEDLEIIENIFDESYKQINDKIENCIINNTETISNVHLSKMLKLLYIKLEIKDDNNETYDIKDVNDKILLILDELENRQNYDGCWNNLSETSEVLISLLSFIRILKSQDKLAHLSILKRICNKSFNYILKNYDYSSDSWLMDENTTAKILDVLYLYDTLLNYAFDDFIFDLYESASKNTRTFNASKNIVALDDAQKEITRQNTEYEVLNNKNKDLLKQIEDLQNQKVVLTKQQEDDLQKYKKARAKFITFIVSILLLFIGLIIILVTNYRQVISEILAEHFTTIITTIIGFVITALITNFTDNWINKNAKDTEKKKRK